MPPTYAWRTIANAECDANSPIKQQLIEALYLNLLSMAEGDPASQAAGAWKLAGTAIEVNGISGDKLNPSSFMGPTRHDPFVTSKMADGTFGTAEVKRSSQTLTGIEPAINTGSHLAFNAASHYMLGYESWVTGAATSKQYQFRIGVNQINLINDATFPNPTTWVHTFKYSAVGVPTNINVTLYYINASPPYDLGDGEIQGFVYALQGSNGGILGISISPDPPWYRPPHPKSTVDIDGIQHVRRRVWPITLEESAQNQENREIWLDAMRNPDYELIPITPEFKNEGMDRFPHPFVMQETPAGSRVVMIDPAGRMSEDIINLKEVGEDPNDMIFKKDIQIKDKISGAKSPPGVEIVQGGWR